MTRSTSVLAATVALLLVHSTARAQDSLQAAKDLYASAAYEDALAVLGRLHAANPAPEVEQFRVFCLIALGKTADAEKAIQTVVAANPMFVPDAAEVPPRILDAFNRTRRQVMPELARSMYSDAKGAYERKDRDAAVTGFERLVRMIDSMDGSARDGSLTELRLLASGFLDLSRALRPKETDGVPSTVSASAVAAAVPAPAVPAPKPAEIVPAIAIKQSMPPWMPGDGVSRQGTFVGEIRVHISALGRVEGAEIVRSVHPVYDRLLLNAARSWEYQPATRNGTATPSDQVIQVQLKPRE
jgi:TonB family protein